MKTETMGELVNRNIEGILDVILVRSLSWMKWLQLSKGWKADARTQVVLIDC